MEPLLPELRAPALERPSYEVLNMAFGVGAGAILGDKSRYRSHGTITTATWAAGVHGYCLDFNQANPDYVSIPAAHTQLNFIAEDFSYIARVRVDALAQTPGLTCRGLHNTDGWFVQIAIGGQVQVFTNQALAAQFSTSSAGSIVAGNWYTIGFSRAGASVNLYINGVLDTPVAGVHINPLTSARIARIGIYDDTVGNPLDGRMEFLRIFRGIALAASEHLAWHRALA